MQDTRKNGRFLPKHTIRSMCVQHMKNAHAPCATHMPRKCTSTPKNCQRGGQIVYIGINNRSFFKTFVNICTTK